jgi:hypothetical protein
MNSGKDDPGWTQLMVSHVRTSQFSVPVPHFLDCGNMESWEREYPDKL